jgi:FtsP/CotA-like multicopper oxidase with cupredoxin domain
MKVLAKKRRAHALGVLPPFPNAIPEAVSTSTDTQPTSSRRSRDRGRRPRLLGARARRQPAAEAGPAEDPVLARRRPHHRGGRGRRARPLRIALGGGRHRAAGRSQPGGGDRHPYRRRAAHRPARHRRALRKPATNINTIVPRPDQIAKLPITGRRVFTFSETANGNTFFINNTYKQNVINTTVPLGAVEEWTLRNTSGELHVFHIQKTGLSTGCTPEKAAEGMARDQMQLNNPIK